MSLNKIKEKEEEKDIMGNQFVDVSENGEWRTKSDREKNQVRLSKKKEIKKLQKDICGKLKCQYCPTIKFTSVRMFKLHTASKQHLSRLQRSNISDTWSCKICQLDLPNESEWDKHSIGKKHLKNMRLYAEKNFPTNRPYFESDLKDIKQSEYREETDEDGEDLYPPFIDELLSSLINFSVNEELKNSSNISDRLLYIVWNNIYLRNEIHKHILKFIEYSVIDLDISQYDQFKYRSYITTLNWYGEPLPDKNEFPPFLTSLYLFYFFEKLTPTSLPNTITTLTFGNSFDQLVLPGTSSFGDGFNQVILPDALPNSLTTLTLGSQVVSPGTLPNNLTQLTFGHYYNQVVQPGTLPKVRILPGTLPNSLTTLTFGYEFNQVVPPGTLPNNLTTLTFGNNFNQVVLPGTLPNSLTTLTLYDYFKQVLLPDTLPNGLTKLTFSHGFEEETI
ncbi:hypothetical protein DICPUDRAFT_75770 [Dictyostelium purpureum]|uniref:U1-type domain-containing protein n=1 Tax=Dictyostelium purpureum TaxID=5786 RepID=F0ZBM5_DICPU|nr:uncharacterized protein DICPUDRAFT_75770 [Dictyostelium purpureum]EGC38647.1 hypothetical protein DICPUDRAFT_75770 [Dictyostelium purpureum]|eukprot:XP_003284840.1 hypothetical protein DICPUDRAFT_75770 [Dictyostelium purpureum]